MDAIFLTSCVTNNQTTLFRPLGSYQIAWYLRENGYNVQVLDFLFKFTEEQILRLVAAHMTPETKVIGFGMMIDLRDPKMGAVIKKFENVLFAIKKRYPQITLILGSPSAPYFSRLHRNKTLFDYVFVGHAEDGVLALMNHIYRKSDHPQFELVEGNRVIRESFVMPGGNKFSIETCGHVWHDSDYIQPNETLPLELSRGCIFKCKFCRYPHIGKSKKDFNREMECIKHELITNYERWGVTNYYMLDDTFNADQDRMRAFAGMTATLPFKIRYATYLRIDLMAAHPETEDMLLESGLLGAFLGLETLNQEAADMIGKTWNGKNAREYLPDLYHNKWSKQVSFRVGLICGLPPETFEDCQRTNQWLVDNEISGWWWHGLTVLKDAHSEYRSEFDKNAELYGFEWEMREGRYIWKTKYCDSIIAREWQVKLNNEVKDVQCLTSWDLLELGNYGIDLDVAKQTRIVDFDWIGLADSRKVWLQNYYRSVINKSPVSVQVQLISN